ncbi:acyl-CoA dehydrogenase family protein [Haliangium ochraceum]|uniref:Acyl-CoA dehydrogenase domain protein n=1 Tax=Haliangium ochraceum (strain DSM 14365 / JCM 11303 / SMP-2) TaxID=502025 RepID=D0LV26_HALO1|nr:acyl-CoA dehydrogenase family protein [Haliangium ochraceum]ACY15867.1 acyl-CoA dehydrogenase domain protein [Haliangium ochraceum DSM 14365]
MAFDLSYSEEQQALIQTARDFTKKEITPVAAKYDESGEFPRDVLKRAWDTGLLNIEVPEEYGGLGGSCLDHSLVLEEVSYGCLGFNTSLAANMLGAMPVIIAGTDEQKKKYLTRLTEEPIFAAYCCSEPDAGSDVAGLSTRVEKHGDDYVINGQKRWITNGGVASWYTVLATFDKSQRHKGIACFVVDADTPGVKTGRKEDKMGQRASNTTDVIFEDVKVPKSALIGPENGGFKVAMKTFDRSRPWIAAGAAGVIRRALDESRAYALERKTFGTPIAQHQAIQFMIADMGIAYENTRMLCHKAAWNVDRGELDSVVSAYAKAYGADAAMRVTTDAVQVFGGYGYTKEYPVEKLMRDTKLLQIYEGTSQIQRVVIARNLLGR